MEDERYDLSLDEIYDIEDKEQEYSIQVIESHETFITIKAKSEKEAKEKVEDMICDGTLNYDLVEYEIKMMEE